MKKGIKQNTIRKTIRVLIAVLALFLFNIDKVRAVTFSQNFGYTGGQQTLTVPYSGEYKIELWGAQGGNNGGHGGYTAGTIKLNRGQVLYFTVGGAGGRSAASGVNAAIKATAGGYNGGGNSVNQSGLGVDGRFWGSGGGATDVRIANDLNGRIMVAGGGGGSFSQAQNQYLSPINPNGDPTPGAGGLIGYTSTTNNGYTPGIGGNQTAGGSAGDQAGSFGYGGNASGSSAGGGGGWYGGSASGHIDSAGGGSSYISGHTGSVATTANWQPIAGCSTGTTNNSCSVSQTGYSFTNTTMIDGRGHKWTHYDNGISTLMPNPSGGTYASGSGNVGNGYARITLVRSGPYLSSLTVKKGSLKETFLDSKFNYTWIIPKGVDTLTDEDVTALPTFQDTTVVIPENVDFTQDGDTFVIQTIDNNSERYNYTLTMQRYVSNDARLASLTSNKGKFREEFNSDTKNYTLEIYEDVDSIVLDAEPFEQDNQGITGIGEIELDSHEKDVEITSTAEDGTVLVYKVHIIKNMFLDDIIIEGLNEKDCEKGQCEFSPEYNKEIESYTMYLPIEYVNLNVSYVPSSDDFNVGIRINEVSYVPGYKLQRIKNTLKFNLYNDDNEIVKSYTITLIRDNTESGKIKDLAVNKGYLLEDFHKNKYDYSWVIPKGVNQLTKDDVTVKLFDTASSVEKPQVVSFTQDGDKYIVKVKIKENVDFGYSGGEQTFTVPYTGRYKLETWGAASGLNIGGWSGIIGGYGGYSVGSIDLSVGDTLYINVGGQPIGGGFVTATSAAGGYNGGGAAITNGRYDHAHPGGGATHIATESGLLSSFANRRDKVLIVSGGGGGGYLYKIDPNNYSSSGGSGGGYLGGLAPTGQCTGRTLLNGALASQTGAGSNNACSGSNTYYASFGQGGSFSSWSAGGGGGWFGGGFGYAHGANGGSGYIGKAEMVDKHMTGYNVATSNDVNTRTYSTTLHSGSPIADYAKEGHGYARITLLDADTITKTYTLTMQREISDDARLATLTSDKGIFTEEFDKDKDEYVLEMYHKETKVSFDATPFEQDAEVIDGLGEVDLPTDETEHHITVQAENGTIKVYTVIIRRNMYLEDLGLNGLEGLSCKSYECNMIPSFSPQQIYYEYRVPLDYNILDVYYEPASAEHRSEMTINGRPYVDGYVLPYSGVTTVKVHVYNDDDEIVKTYTMNVIKKYEETEDFEYTGNYQTFKAPRTGKYYMQTWGASGGDVLDLADDGLTGHASGGRGGYSSGYVELNKDEILYIYVGGQGSGKNQVGTATGGYNGGGDGYLRTTDTYRQVSSGGGATDIRLVSGAWNNSSSLASRIMVAGGGGGAHQNNNNANNLSMIDGGVGGTLTGGSGVFKANGGFSTITPTGGTQTYGGQSAGGANAADWQSSTYTSAYIGSFGQGASISTPPSDTVSSGGGGGGYFGGATGVWKSGGGGSSFISGYKGSVAVTAEDDLVPKDGCANGTDDIECSYHYSGKIFTDAVMKAGNENMPTHDNEDTMTGNTGDGYAKIKLEETETMLASLDVDSVNIVESFDKFRTEYTWIIPKGVDDFTGDNVTATLLHPDKAHIEWPSEPVHFTENGDKFTFKVVADNGEEDTYTLTMIREKSSENRLKTLESDKGVFTPAFDPDTNSYVLEIYEYLDKITLSGEPMSEDATVSGFDTIDLDDDIVEHEIMVTAEDGTIGVYNITIKKDAYLLSLGLNKLDIVPCVEDECTLVPQFEPSENEYSIKVPYEYTTLDVYYLTATPEHSVKIKVGGVEVSNYSLPVGDTEVTVELYNKDNVLVNTYTMTVNRDKGNYATLDNLEVSIGDLNTTFDRELEEYTWIIPNNISTNLEDYISYITTDPGATVELIPSSISYTGEGSKFDIKVTAEDGVTTKTYTINLQQDIIEDIEVEENMLLTVGETKNLYVNGLPEGSVGKYLYEVDQNAIIWVYDNGDVYGLFPGDATVTISVKNHPEIDAKTVHVTVVSDKLESDIYEVRDDSHDNTDYRMVVGAEDGTTISEFKDNMLNPNEYIKIYDKDGNEVDDDEIVKTGLTIKLEINGTVHDEASMVVKGDVDGDGFINVTDYIAVLNHALALEDIEDYIKFVAGDVAEDEILNVTDYIKIMDYALGNIDSINN